MAHDPSRIYPDMILDKDHPTYRSLGQICDAVSEAVSTPDETLSLYATLSGVINELHRKHPEFKNESNSARMGAKRITLASPKLQERYIRQTLLNYISRKYSPSGRAKGIRSLEDIRIRMENNNEILIEERVQEAHKRFEYCFKRACNLLHYTETFPV